jgi:hypothetical protein
MSHGFGREVPPEHAQREHRPVTRYLVLIGSGDDRIARLLLETRVQVEEFDAGAGEVADMIQRATASTGASGPEWDRVLSSHSAQERAAATVYLLDI